MTYRYHHLHHHKHQTSPHHSKPKKGPLPSPRIIAIPPPPPGFPGFQPIPNPTVQPALTIIHVCRICLRPRSERYHIEHPIPANGVPPPPGICKRCRITSVEVKSESTKIVRVEESDKVRLGISAFVPQDRLVTREEAIHGARKQNDKGYAEIYVRQDSSEDEDKGGPERGRFIYRQIKRTTKSAPGSPTRRAEVSAENLAAMNLMNDRISPRFETGETTSKANATSGPEALPASGAAQYTTQYVHAHQMRQGVAQEPSTTATSPRSSKPGTDPTSRRGTVPPNSAKASVSVHTAVASNHSNVTATAQANTPTTYGYTESEIRSFARDEVERYRQAERRMDAHPNAFAHGRLIPIAPTVPVQRRIEVVREEPEPKPWETQASPPPSNLQSESVFAATRSKRGSSITKARSSYYDRTPSQDSRDWYHVTEVEASTTKSESSRITAPETEERSARDSRIRGNDSSRLRDVQVVMRRDKATQPPARGLPESDAPASVRLKEVVGMIREEPPCATQTPTSQRHGQRSDVIEVIEEIELPPGMRLTAPRSADRFSRNDGNPQTWQWERRIGPAEISSHTDRSYWKSRSGTAPSSRLSSLRQEASEYSREPSLTAEQGSASSWLAEGKDEVFATPSPRQFIPRLSSHGRSDDDSWYAARVKDVKTHQQVPLKSDKDQGKDDDEKTVWPRDETPVRPAASDRPSLRQDWDWEYRQRIVKAADRPLKGVREEHTYGRQYTDVERLIRHRRPSQSSGRNQESEHESKARNEPVPPRQAPPLPPNYEKEPLPERGREPHMRTSEESAHVRFASKVEFSPTPPQSDDYPPERILHIKPPSQSSSKPAKKSSLRTQIDGGASEPPESAEDLIAEYESNRSRRGLRGGDVNAEYVSARYESTPGRGAAQSLRSEPRSFRSEESRRSGYGTREQDFAYETAKETGQDEERRSMRSLRRSGDGRHSSPDGTETATMLSRQGRFARALSESPSRERVRRDYLRAQQQDTLESEQPRGRRYSRSPEIDGKGPYREEARTESLDALYGSGHAGAQERKREYVVKERW